MTTQQSDAERYEFALNWFSAFTSHLKTDLPSHPSGPVTVEIYEERVYLGVEARLVVLRGEIRALIAVCPFCGGRHEHNPERGLRQAHCRTGGPVHGFLLKPVEAESVA